MSEPLDFVIPGLAASWQPRHREDVISDLQCLLQMHRRGEIGGDLMPEDSNPHLPRESVENYHYFTLPMSLNYQRNSYSLWSAAKRTFEDSETKVVFNPSIVVNLTEHRLRALLTRYRLALQPTRHTQTWQTLCTSLCDLLGGDIRNLFSLTHQFVPSMQDFVQKAHKQQFPYLSGPKIFNYWLYVMDQYTDASLDGRYALSVAPDTHVIQATIQIGLIDPALRNHPSIQSLVSTAWSNILMDTGFDPIDVHTPLWLWSRSHFKPLLHYPCDVSTLPEK